LNGYINEKEIKKKGNFNFLVLKKENGIPRNLLKGRGNKKMSFSFLSVH
jgi:hypothetical protein